MNQPDTTPKGHRPRFIVLPLTERGADAAAIAEELALEEAQRRSDDFLSAFQEKYPATNAGRGESKGG